MLVKSRIQFSEDSPCLKFGSFKNTLCLKEKGVFLCATARVVDQAESRHLEIVYNVWEGLLLFFFCNEVPCKVECTEGE